jgi:hypothetical protein
MGLFGNLFSGQDTVRGAIEGAGTLAGDIRDAITGEENKLKARELEQQLQLAQVELNKAESNSGRFFALWRPALGWVIVLSIAYTYLVRPLIMGIAGIDMPSVETAALWPILLGMLGLAGYRTIEKANGTQGRH